MCERTQSDEIEITQKMTRAAWGTSVSPDDSYNEKDDAYASIFASMILACDHQIAKRISKLLYKGETLRDCQKRLSCGTERDHP